MPPLRELPPGIPQPPDPPDTLGSLMLDRYRLMNHLPMTGYTEAEIHTDVARDTRLNRLVLLRWLDSETVFEHVRAYRTESGLPLPIDHVEDYLAVLPAEAEGAARVGVHPDILTLFDYVPDAGGVQCLVLEYPPGGRLAERLHHAPLPLISALHLTATVARTLHDVHTGGLGHWRLNPENIFLTATGRPKIHGFQRGAANTFVVRDLGALLVSILNGRPSPAEWRSAVHDAPSVPPGEPWRIETDDVPRVLAGHPPVVIAIIQSLLTGKLGDSGTSLLAVAREMEQLATAAAAAEEMTGGVT